MKLPNFLSHQFLFYHDENNFTSNSANWVLVRVSRKGKEERVKIVWRTKNKRSKRTGIKKMKNENVKWKNEMKKVKNEQKKSRFHDQYTLHKRWSFPLTISLANVTKSVRIWSFTVEILNGKLHFLWSDDYCYPNREVSFFSCVSFLL